MLHLFQQDGRFEAQAVAAMSEAYNAALKELHDTGQPELVLEIIAECIIASASIGERDPVRLRVAVHPWLHERDYASPARLREARAPA
jgi:hypothetical protein